MLCGRPGRPRGRAQRAPEAAKARQSAHRRIAPEYLAQYDALCLAKRPLSVTFECLPRLDRLSRAERPQERDAQLLTIGRCVSSGSVERGCDSRGRGPIGKGRERERTLLPDAERLRGIDGEIREQSHVFAAARLAQSTRSVRTDDDRTVGARELSELGCGLAVSNLSQRSAGAGTQNRIACRDSGEETHATRGADTGSLDEHLLPCGVVGDGGVRGLELASGILPAGHCLHELPALRWIFLRRKCGERLLGRKRCDYRLSCIALL